MKRFAQLFAELDRSTATLAKVDALKRYFAVAEPRDAAWAVYFLAGGKPRQVVPSTVLWQTACRAAGIDDWLFDACYQAVGDFAETVAHVLPPPRRESDLGLADWIEERLLALRGLSPEEQSARVAAYWDELDTGGRFLLNKLIGGSFRVGVSKLLVQRALAEGAGIDAKLVAQRMMGYTDARTAPSPERYRQLTAGEGAGPLDAGQPYPFFLAHQLDAPLAEFDVRLAAPDAWIVEWKYDGIRAQVVRRASQVWIWSRGEELVTERFPEVCALAKTLPDGTVLDGEIVVWKDGRVAPFALLQQRIGRKVLTKKVLADAPVGFIAYDVLEWQGADLRERPQGERRAVLEAIAAQHPALRLSPVETRGSWTEYASLRAESRARGVEGFMLKHREARYGTGRRKQDDLAGGTWWKWKIDPLAVDCVLIYAQAGHGRRASVYTDYTFAVWSRTPESADEAAAVVDAMARREPPAPGALQLVPFAKAYSGLTDEEFRRIDRVIRQTTLEKFGPVRSVRPSLVFELGFEGINRSSRHKSGIAVRFPRMLRIRDDKPLHEADTLQTLEALLELQHGAAAGDGADPGGARSLVSDDDAAGSSDPLAAAPA
ncbi:ATP-dependent DNA ligase [Piscinibacter koreensis]|uniref:ATP-dependent DNA ligase n=1 Tax=Piscinibacter koreensis TaxID=2742824 RepID=A0A7Y6NMB7_9BURK|nr:ATP-dependent DNA ligase [Schlegelella koreensis]NUZ05787.1 ATP-dependent DNA ligase [Schlegelella koreensis]